jgi:hypothetical protein
MKRILLTLAMLWSLVGLMPPVAAQSPELIAAYKQYKALNAQGKYSEAEPFARKTLELGKAEYGLEHKSTAIFFSNLAELYGKQVRCSPEIGQ